MKKVLLLGLVVLLALAVIWGCGKKAEEDADRAPAEVVEAEMADSTRLDSAAVDTTGAGEVVPEEVPEGAGH